uniref:Uncharacterized protein n=1 Tax=Anguilla anguilla TaxID=7936 RepID=A0A0E9WX48_ANGAN
MSCFSGYERVCRGPLPQTGTGQCILRYKHRPQGVYLNLSSPGSHMHADPTLLRHYAPCIKTFPVRIQAERRPFKEDCTRHHKQPVG